MSHPFGMTNGRMLGAAALAAPYFAVIYTVGMIAPSLVIGLVNPPRYDGSTPSILVSASDVLSWMLYGFTFVVGFAAIAAVTLGFPLALLARRLLRRARRPRTVILAAFLTGLVVGGIVIGVLSPLLLVGMSSDTGADPWSSLGYVAALDLAAGISAAAAWASLWAGSAERRAARTARRQTVL